MPFPGVNMNFTGDNILSSITSDGYVGFIATAQKPENIGIVRRVFNLKDAESKGYSIENEPFIYKQLHEFYNELGANRTLLILGTPAEMSMKTVVSASNSDGLLKIVNNDFDLDIVMVGIVRKPHEGYAPGNHFIDQDVSDAVLASLPLLTELQKKNKSLRVLFEGRVADSDAPNIFKPNTSKNGYAGVVLGGTLPDGSAAVSLALARACKYPVHIKLGNGENGSLSVSKLYIGNVPADKRLDAETLHDDGFITFHKRPALAGYYFGVDNMASSDDFKILAHGRVADKAQRIVAAKLTPKLESDIDADPDGSPRDIDCVHLSNELTQALKAGLAGQISNVRVLIDPEQGSAGAGIIDISTLNIEISIQPKGYLSWFNVKMGLQSHLN